MRKAFVLFVFFFILISGVSLLASASLRITDFAAQIVLDEEGTLHVEEKLDVDFYSPHHGIERWIPVSYRRPTGENITIDLKVISVTQDGGEAQYTTRRSGRDILLWSEPSSSAMTTFSFIGTSPGTTGRSRSITHRPQSCSHPR
jgi:hypothetical protein